MRPHCIRPAQPADAATLVAMMKEFAEFEDEPAETLKLTADDVLRDGFGQHPKFEVLLAELHGEVVGFLLFFQHYSAWEGRSGIYIEDLYVRDSARGHGLGRRLLAALAQIAVERDCRRIELDVLDGNPTCAFYAHVGMQPLKQWLPYRMAREAIERLAGEAPTAAAPA